VADYCPPWQVSRLQISAADFVVITGFDFCFDTWPFRVAKVQAFHIISALGWLFPKVRTVARLKNFGLLFPGVNN
jgi:hypothetical protein